jgi:hypothetical protein
MRNLQMHIGLLWRSSCCGCVQAFNFRAIWYNELRLDLILWSILKRSSGFNFMSTKPLVGRTAQSVLWLATSWTVRRSNPGGGDIFRNCPDQSRGPHTLLHKDYRGSFSGIKRHGRGIDQPTPTSAEGHSYPISLQRSPPPPLLCRHSMLQGELYILLVRNTLSYNETLSTFFQ